MTEQVSVQSIRAAPDTERKLIAIVYADMAGYSRLIAHNDTETICRLQNLRRNLIEPSLERHAGILVNTAGDSLLATFSSITCCNLPSGYTRHTAPSPWRSSISAPRKRD
jgi:class 3 adenylate cyclase